MWNNGRTEDGLSAIEWGETDHEHGEFDEYCPRYYGKQDVYAAKKEIYSRKIDS